MRMTALLTVAAALFSWTTNAEAWPLREALAAEALKLAAAQTAVDEGSGWQRVEQLRAGQEIVVWLRGGSSLHGRVVHADQSNLRVNDTAGSHLIARADIYVIRMARGRGSPIGAAIGAAGGALLGLAFVSRIDYSECNCLGGSSSALLIPAGAAIALGFAGYHAVHHPAETIYASP